MPPQVVRGRRLSPVAVVGAGSWGTALAVLLARGGEPTRLWGRDAGHVAALAAARENTRYLPGVHFPRALEVRADLASAVDGSALVLVAVPSHALRDVLDRLAPCLPASQPVAWATKGLERGSGKLPHEVAAEVLGARRPQAAISGPTFAAEVARDLPTAVTVASADAEFAADLTVTLHGGHFRAYAASDLIGVGVGGAVKNALAIGVGVADGLGFGANARAALITRGLSEMMRLGAALGAHRETFMGLAGLGDLVLTCTDDQSRNRRMGLALAAGRSLEQAQAQIGQVVEGVYAAVEVWRVACAHGVDMPITEQVQALVQGRCTPAQAARALIERPPRRERG